MDPDFESRANQLVEASGGAIWINSGDRDTETQQRLWDEAVIQYGEEEARNWVAPPGNSFHEKGLAIDFGGDMELLAQLAPQYGLYQPMSWEPWHWEPLGSRDGTESPLSKTIKPTNPSALLRQTRTRDYSDVMQQMLGIRPFAPMNSSADISLSRGGTDPIISSNPGFLTPELLKIFGPLDQLLTEGPRVSVPGLGPNARPSNVSLDGSALDRFMYALRTVESNHNYTAIGVPTPWGTAKGAYQYLDGTWDNYGGYASADLAPPEVQDEKARADMQRYYDEYGSWDSVSAAWYSGPGGNWQSQEVQEYVGKVNSNL
jgi:hypothetical protein